jgi:putative peptide zinc metalloprotease protein
MLLVFPLLKAIHEFGHACAVKAWGGEVHEMGIMLLVLMPIPFVDASSASAFPEKYRRVIVGAAGMVVELFVASIALFFWLELETGWLRAVLFNAMLIAGVSTVLFNANPLLRFDGYYMLADLIEIPNLRVRGAQYLQSVFERRLFGLKATAPESSARERAWLVFFTIASFIYRLFITFAIALFIAGKYFIVGVILAIFAVVMAIVLPLAKVVAYLALHPRLRRHRLRAAAVSGVLAGALVILVFGVPVPAWTNAEGVIWVPEQAVVRAGANGFVARVVAQPGSQVRQGDALIETVDPMLPLNIRALEAQKQELQTRYQAERIDNLVRSQITLEQLKSVDADLDRAKEKAGELIVRSPADGVFVVTAPQDLPDRFLKQGEQIGYVLTAATATARVLVPQQSVDMVRKHTEGVRVKLAERLMDTLPATIRRELPGASDRLPSMALAQAGGGKVALDPSRGDVPKTLQTHFEFELELPTVRPVGIGGRVYVRFEHQAQTVAAQVYRSLRQLFLERFAL